MFPRVIALFILTVIVKGNIFAAVARPVFLTIGTVFTVMHNKKNEDGVIDVRSYIDDFFDQNTFINA